MKKVFISTPMKNRTEEQIKEYREHQISIVKAIIGEEVEVINSYVNEIPPADSKESVWYMGKSLQTLSEADCLVVPCFEIVDRFAGIEIECRVASLYGIEILHLPKIKEDDSILFSMYNDSKSACVRSY